MASIGPVGATASLGAQIEPEVRLIGLDPRGEDADVYERLRADLELDRPQKWPVGFEFVRRLGPVAAPFLERIVRDRGDAQVYLHLDAARVLASAVVEPRQWLNFESRYEDKDALRARFVAFTSLALLRELHGPAEDRLLDFARGRVRGPDVEPLERAAACAALARFEEPRVAQELSVDDPMFRVAAEEPGLAALAFRLLGGAANRRVREWTQSGVDDRFTALVLRGFFLSDYAPRADSADDLERIVYAVGQRRDQRLREAAALHLARSEDAVRWIDVLPDEVFERLVREFDLSVALACGEEFRRELFDRGAFEDSALLTADQRTRSNAAFAAVANPEELRERVRTADPEIGSLLCLVVAQRVLDGQGGVELVRALPPRPERFLARAALGSEPLGPIDLESLPRSLRPAARVAARGGLTEAALRRVLADELWQRGAAMKRTRWNAESLLVRDALLAGSEFGDVFDLEFDERIAPPSGLSIEDPAFRVTVALYPALSEPERSPIR